MKFYIIKSKYTCFCEFNKIKLIIILKLQKGKIIYMKIKNIKLFKGDLLIIALIIVFSVIIFILMLPKTYSENTLEIYLDGQLIDSVILEEGVYTTIEIDETAHNTIEIDGTKVRIINSTCYDHVCENTGYISMAGEIIVCMPNKLLLKIVGDDSSNQYDVVVG